MKIRLILYKFILSLTALLAVSMHAYSQSHSKKIALILSANQTYYQQTAVAISETLQASPNKSKFETTVYYSKQLEAGKARLSSTDLIIAVGTQATTFALQQKNKAAIISVMVPKNSWLELSERYQSDQAHTAIYIDQPPRRFYFLAKSLPIAAKNIGSISSQTANDQTTAFRDCLDSSATFHHTRIGQDENPIAALRPIFAKSDVFIALPDNAIFNRAMAKWILKLSFQTKTPVIGFSRAYSQAGALASIFSSPENIGVEAAKIAENYFEGFPLPKQQGIYPRYFTIESNPAVARALKIHRPSIEPSYLMNKVQELEND